jgi:hypothetical protein
MRVEIKLRVFLFVLERLENAFAKCGGRIGKTQQHQRHQFGGEQFVVRKKMQQLAALAFDLLQIFRAGKTVARLAGGFELQFLRTAGRGGSCRAR